ncbi:MULTISPECIES: hypothetical protein [Bacillus cereus group]|uniref:hypothetical protein n=1 Tax=Bacillus cereus group TaxID=86661 RepID=UPI0005394BD4|nr:MULTISPECIES: hypothetical protein [Bacillus cereus group]MBJ8075316.1 hypothetical protein [Bacillus cereus group sp. N12]MBJ8096657.1 hypothetical protein [Bacillus cereus group sp. N11]PKR92871.1 hypothetical protein bcere0024_048490 [Bacillus cereus Rock4-18]
MTWLHLWTDIIQTIRITILKRKEKEGLIAALLFGSGAINLLTKVKDCVKGIEHKKHSIFDLK